MADSQKNYHKLKKATKMNVAPFLDDTNLPIVRKGPSVIVWA